MTAAIFYFTPVNPDQYLLTSPKVMLPLSEKRVKWRAEAETLKNELPDDAKLYLICQESDGEEWFYFNYELQPLYLCRTLEGGYFVPPSEVRNRYDTFADAAEFSEYLNNNNVDYLVVDRTDGYFEENFASLFTDALESHESGKTSLYERSGEIFAPAEAHSAN